MLRNRHITVNHNGNEITTLASRGYPQGGVLSNILWNMVVDSLLNTLNDNGYFTQAYADDIAVVITGRYTDTLCDLMQNAITIIERWCLVKGLNINPDKSELVMFTNKRKLEDLQGPTLFRKQLRFTSQVKYLGIILDAKLNWSSHMASKI